MFLKRFQHLLGTSQTDRSKLTLTSLALCVTLTNLVAWIALANHINPATASNHLAVRMSIFQGTNGGNDFHCITLLAGLGWLLDWVGCWIRLAAGLDSTPDRLISRLTGLFRCDSNSRQGRPQLSRTAKYIGGENGSNVKTNGKSPKQRQKTTKQPFRGGCRNQEWLTGPFARLEVQARPP
jgi:hypothetical protein